MLPALRKHQTLRFSSAAQNAEDCATRADAREGLCLLLDNQTNHLLTPTVEPRTALVDPEALPEVLEQMRRRAEQLAETKMRYPPAFS